MRPNASPLLLENVIAESKLLVVPALTFILVNAAPPATEPVIVLPFNPKLTPLALEKTTLSSPLLVVPAEKFTFPPAAGG